MFGCTLQHLTLRVIRFSRTCLPRVVAVSRRVEGLAPAAGRRGALRWTPLSWLAQSAKAVSAKAMSAMDDQPRADVHFTRRVRGYEGEPGAKASPSPPPRNCGPLGGGLGWRRGRLGCFGPPVTKASGSTWEQCVLPTA
jgi:hypothetical protein